MERLKVYLRQQWTEFLVNLGVISICEDCGTTKKFDEERFRLGYGARNYCPKCEKR